MKFKSTKSFFNLPVAHMQWFDIDKDGYPGPCAKWHGYDRSVHFEFTGDVDQHGWIVGFGDLKPVKEFLEYYFDHTALAGADDPRLEQIYQAHIDGLVDLRVLPYGVSMEMSALFIWEQVNPFIYELTDGRVYVSKVECREHDKNSALIEVEQNVALEQGQGAEDFLLKVPNWNQFVPPLEALKKYNTESKT
jgi:6-pyruvoyl-tetrahydropterin synthase